MKHNTVVNTTGNTSTDKGNTQFRLCHYNTEMDNNEGGMESKWWQSKEYSREVTIQENLKFSKIL